MIETRTKIKAVLFVALLVVLIYFNSLVSSAKMARTEFINYFKVLEQQQRNQLLLLETSGNFQEELKAGKYQFLSSRELQHIILDKIHQSGIFILDESISNTGPLEIRLVLEADYSILGEFLSWELLQAPELLQIKEMVLQQKNKGLVILDFSYELAEDILLSEDYLSELKAPGSSGLNNTSENGKNRHNENLQKFIKYRLSDRGSVEEAAYNIYSESNFSDNIISYQYQQQGFLGIKNNSIDETVKKDFTVKSIEELPFSFRWKGYISGREKDLYLFETQEGFFFLSPGDSIMLSEPVKNTLIELELSNDRIYLKHGTIKYIISEF